MLILVAPPSRATASASPSITTTLSSPEITAGQSVNDTATLNGATTNAGGTVTYYYFIAGSCKVGEVQVGSPVTVTDGKVPTSASQQFNTIGSYSWDAYYSGDANNQPNLSSCESLTVEKTSPVLSVILSSNTVMVGFSVSAEASLAGLSPTAGGNVTYEFFSGSICSGPASAVGSPVNVTYGSVPHSDGKEFGAAGFYSWNAVYSGDSNNNGATSPCEPFTVGAATVTAITSLIAAGGSSGSITVGGSVADSVSLSGATPNAGGTVTYYYFSGGTCLGNATKVGSPVNVTSARARATVPNSAPQQFNAAGSYGWEAYYSGDKNNLPATSQCEKLTIRMDSPTITLFLTPTAIALGQSVGASATLGGSFRAGGTVTFEYYYDNPCTSTSHPVGTIAVNDSTVSGSVGEIPAYVGSYYLNAVYSGDMNNLPATSQCALLTVNEPGVFISTALSSSEIGVSSSVTDSATLSGETTNAGGTVTYEFFSGGYCLGSATKVGSPVTVTDGKAPNSALQQFRAAGSYSWYAVYSGDSNNNGATSPCEQLTVVQTLAVTFLTVSCNPNPVTVDSATKCMATLYGYGPPTGVVVWSSNSSGRFSGASCKLSLHPSAYYSSCSVRFTPTVTPFSSVLFTANYTGDSNNLPSVGHNAHPLTVTMKKSTTFVSCSPTVVSLASSAKTSTVRCKATVRGYGDLDTESVAWTQSGTGFVSFTAVTCTLVKGSCYVTLTGTQAGSVTVTAIYGGDSNNQGSSSPLSEGKLTIKNAT
jgi:hypothetical protein